MEMTQKSIHLLHRLSKLGSYIHGVTGARYAHRLYAVVEYNGKECICTIPHNGGKPTSLVMLSGKPYPVTSGRLPCYIPKINMPGTDCVKELRWLNGVNSDRGRNILFKALVDLGEDTIVEIGQE